jgi:hypothetical protein
MGLVQSLAQNDGSDEGGTILQLQMLMRTKGHLHCQTQLNFYITSPV